MDAKAKDPEGFSALYYAIHLNDAVVLRTLYYFAVNNCYLSEGCYRNPDPSIVANLRCIDNLLLDQKKN